MDEQYLLTLGEPSIESVTTPPQRREATANDDVLDCKDCAAGRFSTQTARTSANDCHHCPYGQY